MPVATCNFHLQTQALAQKSQALTVKGKEVEFHPAQFSRLEESADAKNYLFFSLTLSF